MPAPVCETVAEQIAWPIIHTHAHSSAMLIHQNISLFICEARHRDRACVHLLLSITAYIYTYTHTYTYMDVHAMTMCLCAAATMLARYNAVTVSHKFFSSLT